MFNPGMANMQGMMKKVQKMQQDMLKMQEELKNRTVEATAGGDPKVIQSAVCTGTNHNLVDGNRFLDFIDGLCIFRKMWKCWKI